MTTLPTLSTVTAAEIAAMDADSVELKVLCAETVGWRIKVLDAHERRVKGGQWTHGLVKPDGEIASTFSPNHSVINLTFAAKCLPNPARDPAAAYAVREWMRGLVPNCAVSTTDYNDVVGAKPNRRYICEVTVDVITDLAVGAGATEMEATCRAAVALAIAPRNSAET